MRIQYGGTKKTLDADRQAALAQIDKKNKTDSKRIQAVNDLVDAFISDKSIHDSSHVDVQVSTSENALSVSVTIDSPTASTVAPTPEAPTGKPLTKKAENEKVKLNATTNTIRARTQPKEPE